MKSFEFRKELQKIMPGYSWTVHRSTNPDGYLSGTGIKTSGFNRISTLSVVRGEKDGVVEYTVKSSGFGKSAPWLAEHRGLTLARALRRLQSHYENMASNYSQHAADIEYARKKHNKALVVDAKGRRATA